MPELPEVQTVVNDLKAAGITGTVVRAAAVYWPRTVDRPGKERFCRSLRGRRITAIVRRAKYIVFHLDAGWHLLVHLRMSGRLLVSAPDARREKHEHVVLDLDDGRQLRFFDPRKFGRLYLVTDPDDILGRLGPEPLSSAFTARVLGARLQNRKRQIKPLLLDQLFVAGLGNIYVDEALWEARLYPTRIAAALSDREVAGLHRAIRKVLRRGLKNLGTTLGSGQTTFYSIARNAGRNRDELKVFRRTGQPCPRCRQPVIRMVVAQRGTHLCQHCQH